MTRSDPCREGQVSIQVDRREIAYLQAIVESYDGLAGMRTLHPEQGIVRIYFPERLSSEVESLLASLQTELGFEFLDGDDG